jgi:hypothetical protein
MSRTLPIARDAFITAMNRDTAGSDRPRYTAVLDAMIEWSLARPDRLRFRDDESSKGVVSFQRVGSNVVFWAARPMRGTGPKIELLPRAASVLPEDKLASAREAINACSREILEDTDRLAIGFGAMKNPVAREAVFTLMDELLQVT